MDLNKFSRTSEHFWNLYLARVQTAMEQGAIATEIPNPVPSFPQSLLVTELADHFALELIGGRRRHKNLRVLKHVQPNAHLYFGQFQHPAAAASMIDLSGSHHCGLKRLAIVTPTSRAELDRRFPGVSSLYLSALQWAGESDPLPLRLNEGTDFLCVEDCLIVNSLASAVRIRNIQLCVVVRKQTTEADFREYLENEFPAAGEIGGFRMLPGPAAEVIELAAQFANIYLMNGLREVSIGKFIDQHTEVLTAGLGVERLISEPYLEWQVSSPDPAEVAINPDLFLVRADGTCDVFDLKLPLLNRKKITRGERRRRRFIDAVDEGIAQLAHYREFLDVPENRLHAESKYGVQFRSPRYGLVVGNYENVSADELADASRQLNDFTLLDYDTLLQLYVGASRVDPAGQPASVR